MSRYRQKTPALFRQLELQGGITIGGCFRMDILDKNGTLIHVDIWRNGIPDAAINHVLGVELGAVAQVTTWYMGLIDDAGFTALASGDTAASHAGWAESTAYSELVRQTVPFGVASGKQIATTTTCAFTMTAPTDIRGGFIASSSVKGGAGGVLFATAEGSGGVHSLVGGQIMRFSYSCSGTST